MDHRKPPSRRPDRSPPLSFSLNQAAALCGVAVHQLSEWVDLGYVRCFGSGEDRRLGRPALRQVLAIREATRSAVAPMRRHALAGVLRIPGAEPPARSASRRPEEFSVEAAPMSDARLALHAELYFAMNPDTPRTVRQLAESLNAEPRQLHRILDSLEAGGIVPALRNGERVYGPGRARLHGPSVREQRVRASRRARVPAPRHGRP